jgi:hypothetical protein
MCFFNSLFAYLPFLLLVDLRRSFNYNTLLTGLFGTGCLKTGKKFMKKNKNYWGRRAAAFIWKDLN